MGHFGILELALLNIDQDPKDSNVHPCCLVRYFYHFLQCLVLVSYEKKTSPCIFLLVQNMLIWETVNKGRPETYFTIFWAG